MLELFAKLAPDAVVVIEPAQGKGVNQRDVRLIPNLDATPFYAKDSRRVTGVRTPDPTR